MSVLDCAGKPLDLSSPQVMGVLNVTPDSFSDGGEFTRVERAVEHAIVMAEQGAAIIDIGGESTRPGAQPVSVADELDRVLPVIDALRRRLTIPLSIDTSKPEVMTAAVSAGAGFINDVNALRADGALQAAQSTGVPVCLMHMQGAPDSMQESPRYTDVVAEVVEFLAGRIQTCVRAGFECAQLVVDPGFGFGKSLGHNLALMRHLDTMNSLQVPVLVGVSRKSMIGALLDVEPKDRLAGGLVLAALAVSRGARLVRTHDVGPTVDALKIVTAVEAA
ncbi:MAG TPA: dihydropteroate synthase [Chromatiales bacterium]|jgi:dihydropteroate synthase|nr:dihydropteroate synthase [Chromatiaceae bacterium]HIO13856.1 dihydropteroate synthase [Chromatiales bacterium]HIO53874.1 dihydropteroate synthase [Chromatiales bacterium]